MIITALANAAQHLDIPLAGYQVKPTAWALTLTPDGELVSLARLTVADDAGRGTAPRQQIPKVTRTSGVAPQLACDTGVYALGLAKPPRRASDPYDPWNPSPRDAACHNAWLQMIRDWETDTGDPAAKTVRAWADAGKPGLREALPQDESEQAALARETVVVLIEGDPTPVHLHASAVDFWQQAMAQGKSSGTGLCSACGTSGPLVDTFPTPIPVNLVPGSDQTSGAALTSANFDTASRDLSVAGMKNASICLACAVNSVAALTALAQNDSHRWRGEDAWTVWWLRSGSTPSLLDWLNAPPDPQTVHQVFDQLRAGRPMPQIPDPDDHYYALTYAGRGPRIVIRSWIAGTLADTAAAIEDYFADSAVEQPWDPDRLWEPLWQLANAPGVSRTRAGRTETIAPHGAHETLIRAALTKVTPPVGLLSGAVQRSRAEVGQAHADSPRERGEHHRREHARACLIRLTLVRSPHLTGVFTVPGASLDPDSTDTAYLCGRLFAMYEGLQTAALGRDLNATITDRTYSKAMTNPLLVFPSLDRLAKAHLRKLRSIGKDPAAFAISRRITELVASVDEFPAALDVPGQARWMLGYYQQRAHDINTATAARAAGERGKAAATPLITESIADESKEEAPA